MRGQAPNIFNHVSKYPRLLYYAYDLGTPSKPQLSDPSFPTRSAPHHSRMAQASAVFGCAHYPVK